MVFCLILYLIGGSTVYYIGLAYCIFATVFFLVRFLFVLLLLLVLAFEGSPQAQVRLSENFSNKRRII